MESFLDKSHRSKQEKKEFSGSQREKEMKGERQVFGSKYTSKSFVSGVLKTISCRKPDTMAGSPLRSIAMSNLSLKLSQDSRHSWHIWVCLGKRNGQIVLTKFLQRVRKGLGKGRGELMPSLRGSKG